MSDHESTSQFNGSKLSLVVIDRSQSQNNGQTRKILSPNFLLKIIFLSVKIFLDRVSNLGSVVDTLS